ncbi:protein kinase [Rhodococcus sp. NPDC127528]|uniref:protein kinase domain-containing protein n=1 Tax=unclassified Rhodococcus (in: high G+C Gram-positive bacteria) TaxID=192944 RepID=UPI003635D16F
MTDNDPPQTQREMTATVAADLATAGFDEAEEIGRGGFGIVFSCRQPALRRTVAVKVLCTELDEKNRERFYREQRAMGELTGHPHIASVLQIGATENGRPYLVLPYYPQGSLDARIRSCGPLTVEEALRLGVKIAGAVATAHQLGIIHRDVKPANILITDYGEPTLTDFGIAHITDGLTTATGTVAGSPAFTAPEVLGGDPPSPAVDVYGLGATLFTALTGHAAFERRSGEQVVAQFLRITTQPVPDLRDHGVDRDVAAVIEHAMARASRDRPTAIALGEQLQQLQARSGFPVEVLALRSEQHVGDAVAPVPLVTGRLLVHQPSSSNTGNLPVELSSFIGRRIELTEAKRLLSASRLVTLTGIGGVGKTRLALRVAAKTQRDFSDGVRWIELGELRDGALLEGVVGAALGLRPQSTRPLREALVDFLAPKQLLLVLDTCEQVVDSAAKLSEILLRACPKLRILTTSREVLGIGGEAVLRVPSLTIPDPYRDTSLHGMRSSDAVGLFAERAAAALPGFELTEDNTTTVTRICRYLDGLPLAIELAAARLRALSPEQVLERLTDRYALLTRGSRGTPTRQRTLHLCVDWSYELCTPAEQQLWAQLSAFAGSFEIDAAEQVCRFELGPDGLLDVVTALVDKSILIPEEAGTAVRFRMLETLAEFGRDKARESGEFTDLRRRHRDWYRKLAIDAEAEWISARQLDWIDRLDREQPNLREALEYSLTEVMDSDSALSFVAALQLFWLSLGQLDEGLYWLDRALTVRPAIVSEVRAKALHRGCVTAELRGDFAAATALVAEAQALAEQTTDLRVHTFVEFTQGRYGVFIGDLVQAGARLERSYDAFAAQGDLYAQVTALLYLGWARELQHDLAGALDCYEKVIAITESHGESVIRSHALSATAVAVWRQGDRDRAMQLLQEALRLARRRRDPLAAATSLESLAWVVSGTGNSRHAVVLMGAAQALGQVAGSTTVVFPNLQSYHEECEQNALRALGQRAFEAAHRDGIALDLDAAVAYALGEDATTKTPTRGQWTALTKRESQVADLVAEGMTNKAIATRLVISARTVDGHVEHVLAKLGFTSRAQIAAWVVEQGRP